MNDRELRGALANVLCNASNFPDKAQSRILGQDLGPLIDKTTDAILESEWLSGVIREAKAEQRAADAQIGVSVEEIARQCESGWPDFGPEDYCHRCGGRNLSWWIDSDAWNAVMRADGPDAPWKWNEIICPACFAELFEEKFPMTSFRLSLDERTRGARQFAAAIRAGGSDDTPKATDASDDWVDPEPWWYPVRLNRTAHKLAQTNAQYRPRTREQWEADDTRKAGDE